MSFKAPKGIVNHPAVAECLDAKAQGFEGYKYDVMLKPGWTFDLGIMGGCQSGRFNTVADFNWANPVQEGQ